MTLPTAVVIGVGAERGLGAALCRRFAKAGLCAIAQSIGREYGPLGIHVAHVVIDGGIATVLVPLLRNIAAPAAPSNRSH